MEAIDKAYMGKEVLGHNAQEKATEVFTAEKMAERHMQLYEQLISEPK